MFNFSDLSTTIRSINKNDFDKYIESIYLDVNNYLMNLDNCKLANIKYDIEEILYDLIKFNLISEKNSKIVNSFLLLLAEQFEQLYLTGAIVEIIHYLPNSSVKQRLEASILYLKVNDLTTEYHGNFDNILLLITQSDEDEEYRYKSINAILNFFLSAMGEFKRVKNTTLSNSFKHLFLKNQNKYILLKNKFIIDSINNITIVNYDKNISIIKQQINNFKPQIKTCSTDSEYILKEDSEYSKKLYDIENPTFEKIKKISSDYIYDIGNPDELYTKLNRGTAIIDDEQLLYKYIQTFANKHKAKLYDAFKLIFDKLNGQIFNIIDWGCGQAFATMILLDFASKKGVKFNISSINLVEPSKLALTRGLLHIDILKQDEYNIKAINCDIDCLKSEELEFNNKHKTLHLFSNILDLESFKLNSNFLHKISSNIKNDNLFVCVSPNINDKRNSRIDLFYNHFDEGFDTELISSREDDILGHKRYEKIFEVKYINEIIVEEKRVELEVIQNKYQFDVLSELNNYQDYIYPILNLKILEDTINIDPEYTIFKIRKVAEVITTRIYCKYETNERTISFNDKIRYLAYEQKVFNKTLTNYVQTLRTIGNSGVHEHDRNISKLKLDAHLMVIALISFIQELKDDNLI